MIFPYMYIMDFDYSHICYYSLLSPPPFQKSFLQNFLNGLYYELFLDACNVLQSYSPPLYSFSLSISHWIPPIVSRNEKMIYQDMALYFPSRKQGFMLIKPQTDTPHSEPKYWHNGPHLQLMIKIRALGTAYGAYSLYQGWASSLRV
jgi:hypothetical protein